MIVANMSGKLAVMVSIQELTELSQKHQYAWRKTVRQKNTHSVPTNKTS
jgi:hypothetical protein